MDLALPDLVASLIGQVRQLQRIADGLGIRLAHVKPHGMLYNDLADRPDMAEAVASALQLAFPRLAQIGLAHGAAQGAADLAGARFVAEGFIDRGYTPARRLVPRGQPGALIGSDDERTAQALLLAKRQPLRANDGSLIKITAKSLCIHSDSPGSEQTALRIASEMASNGITIRAPGEMPDDHQSTDLLHR
jgi:UPF0271 protein